MDESSVGERLGAERQATIARIEEMSVDFDGIVEASVNANIDDEHDPEGATVAFERAQVLALLTQARAHLDELDAALARLAAGTYSVCERCGGEIASERLAARPATHACFACAASSPGSTALGRSRTSKIVP
jgi:RNA polymerase-binding transcription factor DksA